jgi:hypothetical protein
MSPFILLDDDWKIWVFPSGMGLGRKRPLFSTPKDLLHRFASENALRFPVSIWVRAQRIWKEIKNNVFSFLEDQEPLESHKEI